MNKELDYVWLLYNYSIHPEEENDRPYIYGIYKEIPLEKKKELQAYQKEFVPERKGKRTYIIRKRLYD